MFNKSKDSGIKGIKVRSLNGALMILSCILIVLVFLTTLLIRSQYKGVIGFMDDYSECNKAIRDIKDTSSFLSNQARLFSINGDLKYAQNYVTEITKTKRRETALSVVEMTHQNDSPDVNLKIAIAKSDLLKTRELYSMKLICEANNFSSQEIPELINSVELSEIDKKLSDKAKIELAQKLLFDDDYIELVDSISSHTNVALNDLVYSYLDEQNNSNVIIHRYFRWLLAFLIVLITVSIALYIFITIMILRPINNHIKNIESNSKMKMQGSYELRYIAKSYNNLYEKNAVTASVLKHKAEHDPLTGLINRDAFDQIKDEFRISDKPLAYLIIDVDLFKSINDEYGHLIGDDVLRNVATLLQEQFRSSDYVARIGGDEFAVIMPDITVKASGNIKKKAKYLNEKLKEEKDGLPAVSLSIGCSFSEKGFLDSLEQKSDIELYKVKQNGRANISFNTEK